MLLSAVVASSGVITRDRSIYRKYRDISPISIYRYRIDIGVLNIGFFDILYRIGKKLNIGHFSIF